MRGAQKALRATLQQQLRVVLRVLGGQWCGSRSPDVIIPHALVMPKCDRTPHRPAVALTDALVCATDDDATAAAAEAVGAAVSRTLAAMVHHLEQFCVSAERAGFCSLDNTSLRRHARGQAEVFADAWAGAENGCSCELRPVILAEILQPAFLAATQRVADDLCEFGAAAFKVTCLPAWSVC